MKWQYFIFLISTDSLWLSKIQFRQNWRAFSISLIKFGRPTLDFISPRSDSWLWIGGVFSVVICAPKVRLISTEAVHIDTYMAHLRKLRVWKIDSKTNFKDRNLSCDSRLHVPLLRGGILSFAWVTGFRSLSGKFPSIVSLKFKLRKYFTSAREFHGGVVTSWWTSGNDRRKMSSSSRARYTEEQRWSEDLLGLMNIPLNDGHSRSKVLS